VEVEAVEVDGRLALTDGSELCLPGIWVPATSERRGKKARWRSAWRKIIEDGAWVYRIDRPHQVDRYGCRIAAIETSDGVPLDDALLEAGWAMVNPTSMSDDDDVIDAKLDLEDRARRAGRGIWRQADAMPKKADNLMGWIGSRQLVEGRVQRVSDNDRYVYLNFGRDWRTDFTVRLHRKMIEAQGFDATNLDGKTLRVRGVLQDSRGPLIDVSNLKQIELLP
ncbi:MAG: thermonuclease family protein, partial [Alphaproteobacteria bacterium]|nr:thermonuclease family protein [Alphaproteobacteria bacterium]